MFSSPSSYRENQSVDCFSTRDPQDRIQCRSKGNVSGGARERRRREPLGGSGGMFPQKILKSRGLEMLFPAFSKSYL